MLKLVAKEYTASMVGLLEHSYIKMMAFNEGRNVNISFHDENSNKVVSIPVDDFYDKMKLMFLTET